jgi:isopentenyldiphosphate isomerase
MMCLDKTLFTLNHVTDFLLVQIYVDDIIFGGSSHPLVSRFQKIMESEFQMSMMEELTFFLGIQVKQTNQDIFVHQAKYMKDLMKMFNMAELKPVSTSMSSAASLGPDEDGEAVDQRKYKSMIDSLLYLTATWPDIQFVMALCTHFQAFPRSSHQTTVQRVFRYFKHTPEFGIWYSASSLDLVGSSDADFAGCGIDRKSNFRTCHFLGSSLI